MNKTVSQILQEGKRLLERGWCQGAMHRLDLNNRAHYCVMGAVMGAVWCPSLSEEPGAVDQALAALERALPLPFSAQSSGSLGGYNDHPDRTKEEILALFDRALTEVTK